MYDCMGYVAPAKVDTTAHDTLVSSHEIILDENGNPIVSESSSAISSEEKEKSRDKATEPKKEKKRKPHEEDVNFDEL